MNLKENIRRILKEESKINIFFRRRVPIDELEGVFNYVLDDSTNWFRNDYKYKKMEYFTLNNFINTVISRVIDNYHWQLHSTASEHHKWYDEVFDELENHFKNRIVERWREINDD